MKAKKPQKLKSTIKYFQDIMIEYNGATDILEDLIPEYRENIIEEDQSLYDNISKKVLKQAQNIEKAHDDYTRSKNKYWKNTSNIINSIK